MKGKLNSLPLGDIEIQDLFWNKYTELVRQVIIPYQWGILNDEIEGVETSHCIANFKIAAGESSGEFKGAVFQDTDVAKWLEAVGYSLSIHRDEELEKTADETIDLIGRAQRADGYLNTYFTIKAPELRWTNLKEGHELYTAGHMIEAAIAYYEATGKNKFIQIVSKFADLIVQTFGPEEGKIHGYPGHQEIELALIKLYRITNKREYLETAKYFIDVRGENPNYFEEEEKKPLYRQIFPEFSGYDLKYSQCHLPVRDQETAEGHAVRAVYMYCAMADLAYEYEDSELLEACDRLWENLTKRRMYLTGSIGSSGLLERFTTDYDLPNDSNYSETCASIGLALFAKRMTEIKKDASYMDIAELALYNTVLSGIAMDGKSFFYVNPLEVWPDNCLERTSKEHVKPVRQKWFGVACCPPNIARTLASLGQYIYMKEGNTLYTNLYLSNKAEVDLENGRVEVKTETKFPFDGMIKMKAESTAQNWKLALRIPEYVKKYQVYMNGTEVSDLNVEKGYLMLESSEGTTEFSIKFELPVRFIRANPNVRADAGKVAVMKGPLVYCLEETDNGQNLSEIFIDTVQTPEEEYREDLFKGCCVIRLKGKRLKEENWKDGKLYQECEAFYEDTELTAIPYCYWCNRTPGEMTVWIKEAIHI